MKELQINTKVRRLFSCLNDFELGRILIPPFQRGFIWEKQQILDFLDSLKKGYPIGAITFWLPDPETKRKSLDKSVQIIGAYYIPYEITDFYYILDGYQRLSILLGCFMDAKDTNLLRQDTIWKKKFNIVYNLDLDIFEFNQKARQELEIYKIPLSDFLDYTSFNDFNRALANVGFHDFKKNKFRRNYTNFSTTLTGYKLTSIDLMDGTLEEATELFHRLNPVRKNGRNDG